jgi:hypothetical protein
MEHHVMRHKLSEYIDRSVPSDEKAEIERHLKTCTVCSDALRELKKTIEHLRAVEQMEPPEWMTQKTMAKVRAEAGRKQSAFNRFFFPLRVKLPVQVFAVIFLSVLTFYITRNIRPTPNLSESPTQQTPSSTIAKDESARTDRSSHPSGTVPQSQGYKALDMKLEYEKPAPPVPQERGAPTVAAKQPSQVARETASDKQAAKPQAVAPATSQERIAPSSGSEPRAETTRKTVTPPKNLAATSSGGGVLGNLEQVNLESYPNGTPKLIVTYEIVDSRKVKLAEERFNEQGQREGIQKEYYVSGQVKTEAQYEHGNLEWYKEFYPDGTKRTEKSNYDWIWLKK